MTGDYALFIIDELLNEWFQPPDTYRAKSIVFELMSYQNWAVKELREYVFRHRYDPVMETIEDFRAILSTAASRAKTEKMNFVFCCAYDAVSCILDVLRNGGE